MKVTCFCISCGKELSRDGEDLSYPPSGGVYLHSCGNYGSTVFDPMEDNKAIECYLCDSCLKTKAKLIVLTEQRHGKTVVHPCTFEKYVKDSQ